MPRIQVQQLLENGNWSILMEWQSEEARLNNQSSYSAIARAESTWQYKDKSRLENTGLWFLFEG